MCNRFHRACALIALIASCHCLNAAYTTKEYVDKRDAAVLASATEEIAAATNGIPAAIAAATNGLPESIVGATNGIPAAIAAATNGLPESIVGATNGIPAAIAVATNGLPERIVSATNGIPALPSTSSLRFVRGSVIVYDHEAVLSFNCAISLLSKLNGNELSSRSRSRSPCVSS